VTSDYRVFISHGWHDRWIARQMARLVQEVGATPFIDIFDLKKGDRIEERIREELPRCNELVALLTPWSVERNWVWTEIAAAWIMRKRFVAVLYGLTFDEVDSERGGAACLSVTNVATLDEFDAYITELRTRISEQVSRSSG
jgi:hypothetical protein